MPVASPMGRWASRVVPTGRIVIATIAAVANVVVVGELFENHLWKETPLQTPPVLSIPEQAWRPLFAVYASDIVPQDEPSPSEETDPPTPPTAEPHAAHGWGQQTLSRSGRTLHILRSPPAFAWQLEGAEWIEVADELAPVRRLAVGQLFPEPTTALVPSQVDEIHVIGLASCVHFTGLDVVARYELLRRQEELANRRAQLLATTVSAWLERGGRSFVPVHALNAGVDLDPCNEDDRRNRRRRGILLIAVNGAPAGTEDLRAALQLAGLDSYSRLQPP